MKIPKILRKPLTIFFSLVAVWLIFFKPSYSYRQIEYQIPKYFQLSADDSLEVGYIKFPLLLEKEQVLAGYGNRGAFETIIDTPYMHIMHWKVGDQSIYFTSMDLLIFPPDFYEMLIPALEARGIDKNQLYLSASHSHHSIGGWAKKIGGRSLAGSFDEEQLDEWLNAAVEAFMKVSKETKKASWQMLKYKTAGLVKNRIKETNTYFDQLFALNVMLEDSTHYLLTSFGAHPTTLPSDELVLSNDYPAFMDSTLRANDKKLKATMFMAGAVGALGPQLDEGKSIAASRAYGIDLAEKLADELYKKKKWKSTARIGSGSFETVLNSPAPRVLKGWHLRNWVFNLIMGKSSSQIKVAQIDNIIMLSYPLDFSSDLALDITEDTKHEKVHVWFNSFSGGYHGYIVENYEYRNCEKPECREMNWSGPYAADYLWEYSLRIIRNQEMVLRK